MSRRRSAVLTLSLALAMGAATALGGPSAAASPRSGPGLTLGQQVAQRAGLSLTRKTGSIASRTRGANPYVSTLPPGTKVDYAAWRQRMKGGADHRMASRSHTDARRRALGRAAQTPVLLHDEEEAPEIFGTNDRPVDAEPVGAFGTGAGDNPRLRILGVTAPTPEVDTRRIKKVTEDNGQLSRATRTKIDGLGGVTVKSRLGDGPHGRKRDGHNDYDFYRVQARAGQRVVIDTRGSRVDTVVALYDAQGTVLGANDDDETSEDGTTASLLAVDVPSDGTYFALVSGFGLTSPLPPDPNRSGSGDGGNAEGRYNLALTVDRVDTDYYSFDLSKGDVIGATVAGSADALTMHLPDGSRTVRARALDASALYPSTSPLPGGGNTTLAYVAEQAGRYTLQIDGEPGRYDATVESYRPGSETDTASRVQTIFLDFDGARVNTGIFGGPGVRTLSPFSSFIARWGLDRSQEDELIDRITDTVRENVKSDLEARGLNDQLAVDVVSSKDSPDVFGDTNVSRVVVGGTIEQSGVPTIGIAQYIDPGNFGHEDTALVLLDVLSDDDPEDMASLNYYLRPESDRVGFVSRAVGNVVSHEIGHFIGNYHTDNADAVHNLMDAGGVGFGENLYGVGADGIGGTADDEDVDYRTDTYSPQEGFQGQENTLNVSAWAFVRGVNAGG